MFLVLDGLPETVSHSDLCELLYQEVNVAAYGWGEVPLHAVHEEGQALDHTYHLHQHILLFTGVVVPGCLQGRW